MYWRYRFCYRRWNLVKTVKRLSSCHQTILRQHFLHSLYNFVSLDCNPKDDDDPVALFNQIHQHDSLLSPYFLNNIISQCARSGSLEVGVQLHAKIIKMGFNSNVYISSAMVDVFCKCELMECANQLFDEMPCRNVVTWNSLMSGYMQSQLPEITIELFIDMIREGIVPTAFSFSAVLVGCAMLETGELGVQVHGLSLKAGLHCNVVVGTGLIDMYSKCANTEASRSVFDYMPDKNIITYTSMVTGYARNQLPNEAMILVKEMLRAGLKSSHVTYNALLSSFRCPYDFDHCKQIHCRAIREGFENNAYLVVTLVTVYSECNGSVEELHKICLSIRRWNQISFNAVVSGFSNLENFEEAMECFSKMRQAGVEVDFFTLSSILKAIGTVPAFKAGRRSHALIFKTGYISNVCVQNGLVSMYARCGKIEDAKKVFCSMEQRDLISWNSLLSGCACHGYGREVIELFEKMGEIGVKPDLTTFLLVLTACSDVGLLDEGLKYFEFMRNDVCLPSPKVDHYACIVDLYARAGYLNEAVSFIRNMPIEPGPSIFKALPSACQIHGNKEIAVRCARKLVELNPNDPATYVLLSNIQATGGSWDHAAGVRKLMNNRGVTKMPALSWI